jgi:2-iminobutanoate/2-iminopropanoate deaminase
MLFVSGQIAIDPETGQMDNVDLVSETKRVMSNIRAILSANDMNFNHVLKASIFLKDMNDFAEINEVYGGYFINQHPARETVEVSRLPKDVKVEISVIAAK